jgi:hypothetical protein
MFGCRQSRAAGGDLATMPLRHAEPHGHQEGNEANQRQARTRGANNCKAQLQAHER